MNKSTFILVSMLLFGPAIFANQNPTVVVRAVTETNQGKPLIVNGVLRSKRDIMLPSTVEGDLQWVVDEGVVVARGEVIARVDDVQLRLRLREQQLMHDRAKVTLKYLQGEVERLKALEEANLMAKTQLAEMVSRRDLAENEVQVSANRIAQLEENIARTEIRAPVTGVIAEKLRDGGEYARRGESLVRLVDTESLELKAAVPFHYLSRINPDNTVDVSVGSAVFSAEVRSMIRSGNTDSQTFDVLIDLPVEYGAYFVSGQFATVSIPLSISQALFVPRDAVVLRTEGSFVFRIDEDNVAQRIEVALGEGNGEMVSVLGNLKAGDRVAIRGVERLQSGQAVDPVS